MVVGGVVVVIEFSRAKLVISSRFRPGVILKFRISIIIARALGVIIIPRSLTPPVGLQAPNPIHRAPMVSTHLDAANRLAGVAKVKVP